MTLFNGLPWSGVPLGSLSCLAGCALVLALIFDFSGLRRIDGPLLARYTNLWRLYKTYQGDMHHVYINLHHKYGNVVRIGPKCVSLAGIDAKSAIYGVSGPKFPKSDFYKPFQASIAGKLYQNLFNTTDERFHASIKKPVTRAYALGTLLEYESFVDTTTENLLFQMSRRYVTSEPDQRGAVCDLGQWLRYYAYDVLGEITFSKSLGFIDLGPDADETISGLSAPLVLIVASQMPVIDRLLIKPLMRWVLRIPTSPVVSFTMERMKERAQQAEKQPADRQDMLSRFIQSKETNPDVVDDVRILSYATSNVNAGADTTAIALLSAFYYLLKTPQTMKALEQEIFRATESNGNLESCVSWAETQQMPYLDAVVKEALRIHPVVGMILERVVPPGGIKIYGHYFPEGVLVGISPWVQGRDRSIYGDDADHWRPERWLDCEPTQLSKMNAASLAFGGGSRTCIGKNIAMLEMYKLIPALIKRFEFSLADPTAEWRTTNKFFVGQDGLKVLVRDRQQKSVNSSIVV